MLGHGVGTSVLVLYGYEWVLQYWSFVDMSEEWWLIYPSSVGTLTHVKTIETCVESAFATVRVQSAIAGRFLFFLWGRLGRAALHQVIWSKKLNKQVKSYNLTTVQNQFRIRIVYDSVLWQSAELCTWLYSNSYNCFCGYWNVCMSRHWKAELVGYIICKQSLPSFAHLLPLKPDRSSVCLVYPESFQHIVLISKSCSYQTVHCNRPCE
jgi:hypothetical protein